MKDHNDDTIYQTRPRPIGGEMVCVLKDEALDIYAGIRTKRIPFKDIISIRLYYKPGSLLTKRFFTQVKAKNGASEFSNVTYRGLAEMVDQNDNYRVFVKELCEKTSELNKEARFYGGLTPFQYYAGVMASLILSIGFIYVLYGAFMSAKAKGFDSTSLFAFGLFALLALYMGHIMKNWAQRNRPQRFQPANYPPEVMP